MKKSTKLRLLKDKLNADYERELAKAFQSKQVITPSLKPSDNSL